MSNVIHPRVKLIRSTINYLLQQNGKQQIDLYELNHLIQLSVKYIIGAVHPEAWLRIVFKNGVDKYPVGNHIMRKGIKNNYDTLFEILPWDQFIQRNYGGSLPCVGAINAGYLHVNPTPASDTLYLEIPVFLTTPLNMFDDNKPPDLPEIFDDAIIYKTLADILDKPNKFEAQFAECAISDKINHHQKDTFQRVPEANW